MSITSRPTSPWRIVGDVNPADAKRMAPSVTFTRCPAPAAAAAAGIPWSRPSRDPRPRWWIRPRSRWWAIAYKRPDQYSKDDPVFDVISLILSSGRTGLLYKDLVQEKKIALVAQASATFAGGRYPNLFVFFLAPSVGHTGGRGPEGARRSPRPLQGAEGGCRNAGAREKQGPRRGDPPPRQQRRTGSKCWPPTMPATGDWRKLFTSIDDLNRVTADRCAEGGRAVLRFAQPHGGISGTAGPSGHPGGRPGGRPGRPPMKKTLVTLLIAAASAAAQLPPVSARPHKRAAGAARPAAAAAPSYQDLKFPPLRPIQIPKVAAFTLPNGMKLYLLEDHELPIIHGVAQVRTGNLFDPADKIGLATMTGMVIRTGGTRTKTGEQLDEQLENIAAGVGKRHRRIWRQRSRSPR